MSINASISTKIKEAVKTEKVGPESSQAITDENTSEHVQDDFESQMKYEEIQHLNVRNEDNLVFVADNMDDVGGTTTSKQDPDNEIEDVESTIDVVDEKVGIGAK